MGFALEKSESAKWTYCDYLKWDDSHRYELIDGEVYDMTPASSIIHQRISGNIFFIFRKFLEGNESIVIAAPFDVRFPNADSINDEEILTALQPDIVVISNTAKIDEKGYVGAPDLVVEILSPQIFKHDMQIKRDIYEKAGVMEYWTVDPLNKIFYVFALNDGTYQKPLIYAEQENFNGTLFNDLEVNLREVFS
jgi:Uma2 family endonuclease